MQMSQYEAIAASCEHYLLCGKTGLEIVKRARLKDDGAHQKYYRTRIAVTGAVVGTTN